MVFNSRLFLFSFLPIVLGVLWWLDRTGRRRERVFWLLAASIVFYDRADPEHLWVIALSAFLNFWIGRWLVILPVDRARARWTLLWGGMVGNLGALAYFKYTGFILQTINHLAHTSWEWPSYGWPLGISFFTFIQLMYLIDAYSGLIERPYRGPDYALFAGFFPYVSSGPLVKHDETIPAVENGVSLRSPEGWTWFIVGLFKKIVIADGLATFVSPVFEMAARGATPSLTAAWSGALAFALQLYFDFSGYSDMARGLAALCGIDIPINFNSPFKALNIVDFWSRWHITLTRFLTAYLYNPLVKQIATARLRKGKPLVRKGDETLEAFLAVVAGPTLVTFFLSGLWHGAGWQFIVFGLLHGLYVTVYHAWRILRRSSAGSWGRVGQRVAQLLTFFGVLVTFVFFRSPDIRSGLRLLSGMVGAGSGAAWLSPVSSLAIYLAAGLVISFGLPNVYEWTSGTGAPARWPALLRWAPSWACTVFLALLAAVVISQLHGPTEFIYFQF